MVLGHRQRLQIGGCIAAALALGDLDDVQSCHHFLAGS